MPCGDLDWYRLLSTGRQLVTSLGARGYTNRRRNTQPTAVVTCRRRTLLGRQLISGQVNQVANTGQYNSKGFSVSKGWVS